MKTQTNGCDRAILKLLLDSQLSEAEQAATASHLESCPTCQHELEQLAGDAPWWNEASNLLRPGADAWRGSPDPIDRLDRWPPVDNEPIDEFGDQRSGHVRGPETRAQQPPRAQPHTQPPQLLSTDELGPVDLTLDFLDPSDNPAMIGRLGEYEILELIGRGGMGVVLKGYQRELNRYVAVKVMAPHYASSGAARSRFAREAQAAAAVVHPHVVAIHSVDPKAKLPYLVMPYVAAKSLQARIDHEGPLELKDILRIGKQAAEGLAAAHAQGLVHRDIKPANILLEDMGRVLLTDFGLARAVDDATMTRSGVIAGTPQYMSPEQAHGEAIDHRADLFSLGSVLYAMSTGHPPFRAETTMGILRRICEETPRPVCDANSDVPMWLGRIVERLHAKDPAERFASAAEVAEVLGQCLAHVQQPTAVPLPQSLIAVRTNKATRRRWALNAAGIGSIAIAGVVVLIAIVFLNGNRAVQKQRTSRQLPKDGASSNGDALSHAEAAILSAAWDDGSDRLILDLEDNTDQFEQNVEQPWDDSSLFSNSTSEAPSNNLPHKGTTP